MINVSGRRDRVKTRGHLRAIDGGAGSATTAAELPREDIATNAAGAVRFYRDIPKHLRHAPEACVACERAWLAEREAMAVAR